MTAPRRLPDWRPRLVAYLSAHARAAFRPGVHDCALFVAGAVEAMTGTDLAAEWRGGYRSLSAGRDQLRSAGFDSPAGLAAALFEAVPPILAREGDIAVLRGDDGQDALGLVQGALIYVLRPDGLGLVPLTEAVVAYRVPG